MRSTLLVLGFTALLASPVRAQELLHTVTGCGPCFFGGAVAGVPDADGDGRGDFLVGASGDERAYLYSGATGALLHELVPPQASDWFGYAVAGVPDADGDGRGDLLVGAHGADGDGRAYLYSGATGALLHTLASPNAAFDDSFGYAVAGLPDLDGDGRGDLLIGDYREDVSGLYAAGRAYVFSGATGALLRTLASPDGQEQGGFGGDVEAVPDADGDGRTDLLVGAFGQRPHRAYLFSGATGARLHTFDSPDAGFGLEEDVASVPDTDGDGRGDVLYGISGAGPDDEGQAYLYSGATGALLYTLVSPNPEEFGRFGQAVAGVPDATGDGRGDLLVGARYESPGPSPDRAGRVYLFSGTTGALLHAFVSPNEEDDGWFGESVAGVPDADGDGLSDLLVATHAESPGHAYLFSGGVALAVAPDPLDFGAVAVGQTSAPQAVTFENVRGGPVVVTAVTLGGNAPDAFEIVSAPAVPFLVGPGETAAVEVRFMPTETGPAEATLAVESDAGRQSARLTGRGAETLTLIVTSTANGGPGSLRAALAATNAAAGLDTILFDPALAGQTITLTGGELLITDDVVVDGDGLGVILSGSNYASRVVRVEDGATVALVGLTITKGGAFCGGGLSNEGMLTLTRCTVRDNRMTGFEEGTGAGVCNLEDGVLTVVESTISENWAHLVGCGAGVYNAGTATVLRSTLSGNRGDADATGLAFCNRGGLATLVESTVSGNRGSDGVIAVDTHAGGTTRLIRTTVTNNDVGVGGSLNWTSGTTRLAGSIVAGNSVGGGPDCSNAPVTSDGYNVVGEGTGCPANGPGDVRVPPAQVFTRVLDPALADNGGPTRTHALLYTDDNPALDLGGTCGPTDQRGFPAPLDGPDADSTPECDAGSVEQGDPAALTVAMVPVAPPVIIPEEGGAFAFTVTITNQRTQGQTAEAWVEATRPDGLVFVAPHRGLPGPVTVVLGPGEAVTRTLVQEVGTEAMPGEWTYAGFVGAYPDGAVASASFTGMKEGTSRRGPTGPETGEGWATTYAETGRPVAPGDVWSPAVSSVSAGGLPLKFALHVAWPNPFAGQTSIRFDLPTASRVRVGVYDVLGREVAVLVRDEREAGRHEALLDGSRLPSGTYLVRLEVVNPVRGTADFVQTQRVTLVR